MNNNTTREVSRNTARDRIKLVIKEALAEVGLEYAGTLSTHFVVPPIMVFCVRIKNPQNGVIWEVAQSAFYAFNEDIQLIGISTHGTDHFQLNLRVNVPSALADAPTNEAA